MSSSPSISCSTSSDRRRSARRARRPPAGPHRLKHARDADARAFARGLDDHRQPELVRGGAHVVAALRGARSAASAGRATATPAWCGSCPSSAPSRARREPVYGTPSASSRPCSTPSSPPPRAVQDVEHAVELRPPRAVSAEQRRDAVDRDARRRRARAAPRARCGRRSSDTSRSDDVPPISTATRPNWRGSVIGCGRCVMSSLLRWTARAAASRQLVRRRADVAGAHRQQEVAVAHAVPASAAGSSRRSLDQHRIDAAARAHRAASALRVGAGDRRFAGRHRPRSAPARRPRTAPARSRRAGRACACSDAAGTRPRAALAASRRAPPRTPPRARAGDGRSRRRA